MLSGYDLLVRPICTGMFLFIVPSAINFHTFPMTLPCSLLLFLSFSLSSSSSSSILSIAHPLYICLSLFNQFPFLLFPKVLFRFPDSYYVKWLNLSLLHTLWNLIFVLSNLSLFGLMPFAWFFTEAEGFVGSRRGLWSRFKETCVVLGILFIITVGLATGKF